MSIRAQVVNLLEDLKAELGLTLILVAHDLAAVARDDARCFGQTVLFAFEDEIDARAAVPRRAHDFEEGIKHVGGRDNADELSVIENRQAADLPFQHNLRRLLQG